MVYEGGQCYCLRGVVFPSKRKLRDNTGPGGLPIVLYHYNELQHLYRHFPEFNFIGRVLLEKYYILSEQRLYSLRMQRAQERYAYLLDHHPELIRRVPSKYLPSYLSITGQYLSMLKGSRPAQHNKLFKKLNSKRFAADLFLL